STSRTASTAPVTFSCGIPFSPPWKKDWLPTMSAAATITTSRACPAALSPLERGDSIHREWARTRADLRKPFDPRLNIDDPRLNNFVQRVGQPIDLFFRVVKVRGNSNQ